MNGFTPTTDCKAYNLWASYSKVPKDFIPKGIGIGENYIVRIYTAENNCCRAIVFCDSADCVQHIKYEKSVTGYVKNDYTWTWSKYYKATTFGLEKPSFEEVVDRVTEICGQLDFGLAHIAQTAITEINCIWKLNNDVFFSIKNMEFPDAIKDEAMQSFVLDAVEIVRKWGGVNNRKNNDFCDDVERMARLVFFRQNDGSFGGVGFGLDNAAVVGEKDWSKGSDDAGRECLIYVSKNGLSKVYAYIGTDNLVQSHHFWCFSKDLNQWFSQSKSLNISLSLRKALEDLKESCEYDADIREKMYDNQTTPLQQTSISNTNHDTQSDYQAAFSKCLEVFIAKTKDYGVSWTAMGIIGLTDQILIKATRIKNLMQSGVNNVGDSGKDKFGSSIKGEFVGIANYGVMSLIKLNGVGEWSDFDCDKNLSELVKCYQRQQSACNETMKLKNADYGDIWRVMRLESINDLILSKLHRLRAIQVNGGKTLVSEPPTAIFEDIVNYAIFALILIG